MLDKLKNLPHDFEIAPYETQIRQWLERNRNQGANALRILLILSQQPGETGSGVFLKEVANELQALGFQVFLLAAHYRPLTREDFPVLTDEQIYTVIFNDGQNSEVAEMSFAIPGMSPDMPYVHHPFYSLSDAQIGEYVAVWVHKIRAMVEKINPDIIHVNHLWFMPGVARLAAPYLPIVGTAHGTGYKLLDTLPRYRPIVISGVKRLDATTAVSEETATLSTQGYGLKHAKVIGNGYDPEKFHIVPHPADRHSQLQTFDADIEIPNDWNRLVVYVGKFAWYKGLQFLIRAAKQYTTYNDYKVLTVIVGKGSPEVTQQLIDMIAKEQLQDHIVMLGQLPYAKVGKIVNLADVFVLPSIYEAFGIVLLEALACGIRCVAADHLGPHYFVPQILRDKGYVSLIPPLSHPREDISAYDAEANQYINDMANAVQFQLDQPTTISIREAISDAVGHLTWRHCTNLLITIYRDVISNRVNDLEEAI